ncbi:hypothetical protein F511_22955 [Dorcoceras hygrometricum]|uniref:Uncharacterized protein n=1 Tax=Dorcoceras hygrometricum TaxID=472368 RepID=A0A2Z7B003_9LAMI|nr:hypothetical protein F511_22955 [Dorcoceras hygrometricum]
MNHWGSKNCATSSDTMLDSWEYKYHRNSLTFGGNKTRRNNSTAGGTNNSGHGACESVVDPLVSTRSTRIMNITAQPVGAQAHESVVAIHSSHSGKPTNSREKRSTIHDRTEHTQAQRSIAHAHTTVFMPIATGWLTAQGKKLQLYKHSATLHGYQPRRHNAAGRSNEQRMLYHFVFLLRPRYQYGTDGFGKGFPTVPLLTKLRQLGNKGTGEPSACVRRFSPNSSEELGQLLPDPMNTAHNCYSSHKPDQTQPAGAQAHESVVAIHSSHCGKPTNSREKRSTVASRSSSISITSFLIHGRTERTQAQHSIAHACTTPVTPIATGLLTAQGKIAASLQALINIARLPGRKTRRSREKQRTAHALPLRNTSSGLIRPRYRYGTYKFGMGFPMVPLLTKAGRPNSGNREIRVRVNSKNQGFRER